jgi:tetratricopeptide (TPR) repeat protein
VPTNADILRNLMRLDRREGRFEESVERVRVAVEAQPDNAKLRTLSGVVALMDKRPDDAEAEFKKAVELDASDAASYEHLARLYTRSGRLDEAVATYEEAIKMHPDDANLHHFLGVLYQFGGNIEKAIERYEAAIKYAPDMAESKNNLAYIYAEAEENLDRALDLAQDAKAALPDSANAADTLGWVLFKRGIPSAAISYLKEAEASSGEDVVTAGAIRHHLAQAYLADGEKEQAKETLQRAIAGLEAQNQQRQAAGSQASREPDWVVEARAMLNRLESGS